MGIRWYVHVWYGPVGASGTTGGRKGGEKEEGWREDTGEGEERGREDTGEDRVYQ